MKRVIYASFVLAPLVGASQPMIADPAIAQSTSNNWTGFYVGLAGGPAWGHSSQTDRGIPPGPTGPTGPTGQTGPTGPTGGASGGIGDGRYNMRGGLIGAGIGYNHQFGSWVAGLETDFSYASVKGSSNVCGVTPHACGTELGPWLGTVRGRFGPTWDRWFAYATGGLAYGRVRAWDSLFAVSGSKTLVGWTAGAGIEAILAPKWTAKVEYLYIDLGSGHLYDIVPGVPETVSLNAHVLRIGINYRFMH
jgi:outer membrane immunogenic protein